MRNLLLILLTVLSEPLGLTILYEERQTLHLVASQSLRTDASQSHRHCAVWIFNQHLWPCSLLGVKVTSPAPSVVKSQLPGWLRSSVAGNLPGTWANLGSNPTASNQRQMLLCPGLSLPTPSALSQSTKALQ